MDGSGVAVSAGIAGLDRVGAVAFVGAATLVLLGLRSNQELLSLRLSDEVAQIAGGVSLTALAVAALGLPGAAAPQLVAAGLIAVAVVLSLRGVIYQVIGALRRRGIGVEPVVIVGAGPVGQAIARGLLDHPVHGLHPVGFIDRVDGDTLPLQLLGEPDQIAEIMRARGLRCAIFAYGATDDVTLVRLLRRCQELPFRLYAVPRFFDLGTCGPARRRYEVWGFPLVRLHNSPLQRPSWRVKRGFDVVLSALTLTLTAPLLCLVACAVKLSGPGPVLFRQTRVGQHGQLINILKFRTMELNDDSETCWSVDGDPRVTPIGRWLRQTHVDELPQLFNVLRGDMSLVGPRPERPVFAGLFGASIAGYTDRHRVPVGITGLAQVHGLLGDTSLEERSRFDNRYVDDWSLWGDLVILVRTLPWVLGRRRGR